MPPLPTAPHPLTRGSRVGRGPYVAACLQILVVTAGLVACSGTDPSATNSDTRNVPLPGVPLDDDEVLALGLIDPEWPGGDLGIGIGDW
jgi:hypothetical protein